MAGDTVTTIFGGDDAPFQGVARRVLQTMQGIASFKVPGESLKGLHSHLAEVGTTAKMAATGVETLKGAITGLIGIAGAIAGVTTVVAAFGKAIHEAAERETAAQRLDAVADAGENLVAVTEKLEAASAKTGRDFPELAKGVQAFKEAGVPLEKAADDVTKLNEISLVTGKPLEELTEVFTRMSVKGEASSKDLAKFIAVPGVSALAREFKNLEVETSNLERATAKQIELWHRQDEAANNSRAAIKGFATETGIAAAAFKTWAGPISDKQFSQAYLSGLGSMLGMTNQFQEGLNQIAKETGLSTATIKDFVSAGKLGFESLLSASERYHQEQQKARDQAAQDRLRAQQEQLATKQQGLVQQVQALIEKGIDPAKLDKWFQTFAGKWYQFAHQISETFESFGTPLLEAIKPALDYFNNNVAPKLKEIATNWGTWLSNAALELFHAFETGDWSKVEADVSGTFATAVDKLGKGMELVWETFAEASQGPGVVKAIQAVGELMAETFAIVAGSFGAEIEKEIDKALRHIPGGFGGLIAGQEEKYYKDIASKFSPTQKAELEKGLQEETTEGVPGAGTIGNYVNKVIDILYKDPAADAPAKIKDSFKKLGDGIGQDLQDARRIFKEKLDKIFGTGGAQAAPAAGQGVNDAFGKAGAAANNFADAANKAANKVSGGGTAQPGAETTTTTTTVPAAEPGAPYGRTSSGYPEAAPPRELYPGLDQAIEDALKEGRPLPTEPYGFTQQKYEQDKAAREAEKQKWLAFSPAYREEEAAKARAMAAPQIGPNEPGYVGATGASSEGAAGQGVGTVLPPAEGTPYERLMRQTLGQIAGAAPYKPEYRKAAQDMWIKSLAGEPFGQTYTIQKPGYARQIGTAPPPYGGVGNIPFGELNQWYPNMQLPQVPGVAAPETPSVWSPGMGMGVPTPPSPGPAETTTKPNSADTQSVSLAEKLLAEVTNLNKNLSAVLQTA